ncbi:Coniferyl aldehyde dehydrogenase [Roseovarius albus]|uniref:Aldehyde dehydrogenase n=1 Tax=Roseovarius albus TaxID=1247867 RepID=A0A1X6Z641_9RHOB|nr:coniferyl aldehyde dehydrogenase [Roseovarius albus]SLN42160.1 Coniferyl aldehyde dehydrogenase [Roseovarius albus]
MHLSALTPEPLVMPKLDDLLGAQKAAFQADPMPDRTSRIRRLDKLHNALLDHTDALISAVSSDFSNRAAAETYLTEIAPLLEGIAYYRKRLKRLMKPQRRHVPLLLQPASARVYCQPLGVVGIVVPWNFPIFLTLSPMIGALAAGNRVMLKTSEFAPQTGTLLQKILNDLYAQDEVALVTGDEAISTAFTALPFDHLVFTGSTQVGKVVMRAAAENLTPVTLELGGKSPAIVHEDFPVEEAAKRLAFGKCMNAGQICVAPDYILCPRKKLDDFCDAFAEVVRKSYPSLRDNIDYTAIITNRQKARLERYLSDAQDKGAQLITINPAKDSFEGSRKLPVTLIRDATDDMLVMQEEIFGPILPVLPYDSLDDAIAFVNARPRPLALYYFDWNKARANELLSRTHSGGVGLNETLTHVAVDDMPFGGIGPSGMGHYHGKEGFYTFSKAKGVLRKGRLNTASLVGPPWDTTMYRGLRWLQTIRFRRRKL